VLTCQLMDIISLFIVWHWFKYKILADALEGSTLGHKICRRFANKCVLFYIHQGLPCSLSLHLLAIAHMHDKCKLRTFLIFLMASWLLTCYEKMISWVHKAFLAYWQLLEYIWECCLLNLMSQSGNCGMKWLYRQHCIK